MLSTATGAGMPSSLGWDYENNLTRILLSTGNRLTYEYDGDGRRVLASGPLGVTKTVWNDDAYLLETDQFNTPTVQYNSLGNGTSGVILSRFVGGSTQFCVFDGNVSIDRLTDTSGNDLDAYTYLAYGELQSGTPTSSNPLLYVGGLGYYYDSYSSYYFLRARYYDPAVGRFLSQDRLKSFGDTNGYI